MYVQKCTVMRFLQLRVAGHSLKLGCGSLFIGMLFKTCCIIQLNFTSHISNICIKASQKVDVLLRLRESIPCKAKLIIYKSSILPHLTYCHLVWHNCRSSDSRKIERIQERALRAVFNSHSESYENLLVRAELPSLLNRRLQDIAVLMYKIKYGLAPSIVNELF